MNILDAVIITILIVGVLGGMSRGLIKQVVLLIGLVVCLVFAFSLRTPIATFMYEYLPFFKFGGLFSGVSIINILLYELIAFLIIFSLLYLVLRILLKITGIIIKSPCCACWQALFCWGQSFARWFLRKKQTIRWSLSASWA